MKWLLLLVLTGLTKASNFELGDRIVAVEEECGRILQLNSNWQTSNINLEVFQYVDLYLICQASLNEDKYAYIDTNHVDLSWYPGENDKFPVLTSEGEKYVTKPPPRKPRDERTMKKRLATYLNKAGREKMYKLLSIEREMGQDIVYQQVECEVLALNMLRHPDDKNSEAQHTDCMTKFNCMKERFMEQHGFTRENYREYFPIIYKGRGFMVKTPPESEGSICQVPDTPEGNKRELGKWMSGIEFIGGKLADFGEAGTDFIEKLMKKGLGGEEKLLTKDELDDLMGDAVLDDKEDNDEDGENDGNNYKILGNLLTSKIGQLESKGVEIAQSQLKKAKPAIEKFENIASATGEQLRKLEGLKIKPVIKETSNDLSPVEYDLREKTTNAVGDVKGESVTDIAKESGEEQEVINNSHSWLRNLVDHLVEPEYLPKDYDETQIPSLLKILKEMGGHDADGKDKMSDGELKQMLASLKARTKKRAEEFHLSKDQIIQSAEVVKGVMHAILLAAHRGNGVVNDMKPKEIETANSLVDKLVDYATAEILDKDVESGEVEDHGEEGEIRSEDENKKDDSVSVPDVTSKVVTQETTSTSSLADGQTKLRVDEESDQTVEQESNQTTDDTVEDDTIELNNESSDEKNEG